MRDEQPEISDGEPQLSPIPRLAEPPKRSLSVPDRIAAGSTLTALAMGFVGGYLLLPAIGFLVAAAILLTVGILIGLS